MAKGRMHIYANNDDEDEDMVSVVAFNKKNQINLRGRAFDGEH